MTTATEPDTEPIAVTSREYDPGPADTGPRRVLQLIEEAGLTQTEVARELHVTQSTVSRWYKQAREAVSARRERHRIWAMTVMYAILTVCMMILTAAVATLAWGLSATIRITSG